MPATLPMSTLLAMCLWLLSLRTGLVAAEDQTEPKPEASKSDSTLASLPTPGPGFFDTTTARNLVIFGIVVLVLVVGFFVVRYLRAERRKRFVKRYTRLKASGTAAADEDEDQEEIELSIYEKK